MSCSPQCVQTLVGHTGGVWSSQMRDSVVISGSTDRTLKVWNADSGECVHTLYGHTSTVRCMHLHGNRYGADGRCVRGEDPQGARSVTLSLPWQLGPTCPLTCRVVSGSRDATLRLWDIETGQCLHVLMGHVAAVRCVQYDGNKVVSGAYDYTVKVWDPESESCTHTLQGHTNRVYSLQVRPAHVPSCCLAPLQLPCPPYSPQVQPAFLLACPVTPLPSSHGAQALPKVPHALWGQMSYVCVMQGPVCFAGTCGPCPCPEGLYLPCKDTWTMFVSRGDSLCPLGPTSHTHLCCGRKHCSMPLPWSISTAQKAKRCVSPCLSC